MAYWTGYILDLLVGDPEWFPHPIRYIGRWVRSLERKLLRKDDTSAQKKVRGVVLVLLTVLPVYVFYAVVIGLAFKLNWRIGIAVEAFSFYQMMATRCLYDEGMKVFRALGTEDTPLDAARRQIAMLVSRDTSQLSREGIVKAGVETVSENFADGILAPLLFTALGGVPLGMAYKAVNTLDSMVGYKNERYLDFGRASARLDDLLTYLPARISAGMLILAAGFSGGDWKRALRVTRRDCHNHESPNSPYPESAMAGALGIQLGGPATYFGITYDKLTMGDPLEEPAPRHLKYAARLVLGASVLTFLIWQAVVFFFCRLSAV
jgi:adenosylcobinamide-phosphate synthase